MKIPNERVKCPFAWSLDLCGYFRAPSLELLEVQDHHRQPQPGKACGKVVVDCHELGVNSTKW